MGSFLTTLYDLGARTLVIASFLLLVTISGAGAGVDPIEPFLGAFAGESVTDPTGALTPHDLDVEIRQSAHGFAIHWRSAVIEHGRTERLGHEVHFESTTHSNVYRAHPPPDMMGNARTPDPIDGQPYFWARLSGRTLIVYVMSIPPDGSVDFRIYRRTVAGDRMKLEFTRMRDDVPVITAHGELRRTRVNNRVYGKANHAGNRRNDARKNPENRVRIVDTRESCRIVDTQKSDTRIGQVLDVLNSGSGQFPASVDPLRR